MFPNTANSATVVTNEVVQYVGMAILTPIQYYVCRALGTLPRSPMSYVKLCVLSVSYGSMVSIVVTLIAFATGIAVLKTQAHIDLLVWQGLTLATYAVVLVFVAASHKRFWGILRRLRSASRSLSARCLAGRLSGANGAWRNGRMWAGLWQRFRIDDR